MRSNASSQLSQICASSALSPIAKSPDNAWISGLMGPGIARISQIIPGIARMSKIIPARLRT